MKYLLLVYGASEPDDTAGRFEGPLGEIAESGELVGGAVLADPVDGRTVRVRDGVVAAVDGLSADAGERPAGFLVVDCESPARAAHIAARLPWTGIAAVEVRPIMSRSGREM